MKERPILFSAPMVRAVLADRKNHTRRVIKNPGLKLVEAVINYNGYFTWDTTDYDLRPLSPYGQPGDRLWIRESFSACSCGQSYCPGFVYKADGEPAQPGLRWTPSIYMPRKASRITLEVIGLRVERLQDISEEDARAEGVFEYEPGLFQVAGTDALALSAKGCYEDLWESINGKGSWDKNPLVWVVEFKVI